MKRIFFLIALLISFSATAQKSLPAILDQDDQQVRKASAPNSISRDVIATLLDDIAKSSPNLFATYANPAWITSYDWTKLINTPTSLSAAGITSGLNTINGQSLFGSGNIPILGFVSQTLVGDVVIGGATGTKSVRFGTSTIANTQINNFSVYAAGQINIHTTAGANIQAVNTDASLSSVGQVSVSATGATVSGGSGNAISVPNSGNIALTGKVSHITTPTRNDTLTQVYVRNRSTGEDEIRDASTLGGSGSPSWGTITGTLSSQSDLKSALDAKANLTWTPNVTTTTGYTLQLSDAAKQILEQNATGVCTVTVPPNSSVNFPNGAKIEIQYTGIGNFQLVAGAGVTFRGPQSGIATTAGGLTRFGKFVIEQSGVTDTWNVWVSGTQFSTNAGAGIASNGALGNPTLSLDVAANNTWTGTQTFSANPVFNLPPRVDTAAYLTSISPSTHKMQMRSVSSISGGSLPSQTGNSGKYLTTNGTTASWGATALPAADATHDGYLAMGDWSTFNNKSTLPTPTVDGYVLSLVTGAPAWVAGGGGGLTGLTTNGVLVATGSTTAATPAYLSFVNSSSVSTLNINEAAASSQAAALINLNFTTAGGAAIKGYAGSTDLFNIGFNESATYEGSGGSTGGRTFAVVDDVSGGGAVRFGMGASGTFYVGPSSSSYALKVSQSGSTLVNGDLTVATTGMYTGVQTFASAPVFSTMTSGQVLYAGTSGVLSDDADMTYAAGGNITLGRSTTSNPGLNFAFSLGGGGGTVWSAAGTPFSTFGVNASGNYGGTASTNGGMAQYYYDIQNSAYRWGTGPTGTFYVGPSSASYAMRVTQGGAVTIPSLVGGSSTFLQTNSSGGVSVGTGGNTAGNGIAVSGTWPTQTISMNGGITAGTSSGTLALGGTIFQHSADAGSSSTTETDLYSDTVLGNTLGAVGDRIEADYVVDLTATGGTTKTVRIYFGGTKIFDSGALTVGTVTDNLYHVVVMADVVSGGSSSVRCITTSLSNVTSISQFTKVTSLNLATGLILKITGQSGVGAATNDVKAEMGAVTLYPKN